MKALLYIILPITLASAPRWVIAEPLPPPPDGQPAAQEAGAPPAAEDQPPPADGRLWRGCHGDQGGTNEPTRAKAHGRTNEIGRWRDKISCRPMLKSVEEFKARNPQEFERLMKLRKDDSEAFKREVHERFGASMKEKHPEAFTAHETERENHERVRALKQQYHAATNDAQKANIENQMRVLLAEIFDAKQQARRKELEVLQNRLKVLQQSVEDRATGKQQTLDEQIKDLTQGNPAAHCK